MFKMSLEEINKKTKEIWEKYSDLECTPRPRLVFSDFRKNPDILFIGLNPTFKDSLEGYSEEELKQHETSGFREVFSRREKIWV